MHCIPSRRPSIRQKHHVNRYLPALYRHYRVPNASVRSPHRRPPSCPGNSSTLTGLLPHNLACRHDRLHCLSTTRVRIEVGKPRVQSVSVLNCRNVSNKERQKTTYASSWYCWYSLIKSSTLLCASVNSISSIPSWQYPCRNARRLNMGANWFSVRFHISWIAVCAMPTP